VHLLVSIIITNYNYGKYVDQAIESALKQSHTGVEVIVVDDGSTDDSLDIISRYSTQIRFLPRENGGQLASTNVGYQVARGEVIILLDADDILYPDAVAGHVAALESSEVVKSQGYLRIIDINGKATRGRVPVYLSPAGDYRERFLDSGPFAYQSSFTSGSAWRRTFLDAVMPLPEQQIGFIGPDGYLGAVDAMFGRIAVVDAVIGEYRVHGSNIGPIGYRFDPDYLRKRVYGYEQRIKFAAHHARKAGHKIDVRAWESHAGWKLTLSKHLLSLWGDQDRAVSLRQLCLSPFTAPNRSLIKASGRALQMALIKALPEREALVLARWILDKDWGKRLPHS
jgi:glycosyltransferase involved in cell wall biosynthesis